MEELGLEMKIAALSALAALGSAYWAWSSARSARRTLSIAELDARSRKESLRAELVNALRWATDDVEHIAMACSFSNSSTLSTTIQRVELHVSGFDAHGEFSMLRLPPNGSSPENSNHSPLPLPLNIGERSTVSGWISFRLPSHWMSKFVVDKYQLIATTHSGHQLTVDAYIVIKEGPK